MKKIILPLLAIALTTLVFYNFKNKANDMDDSTDTAESFHDLSILTLDQESEIKFSDFKGQKVLLVNVASECGYTPQYEDLEKLSKQYEGRLTVIGFPCNQFGGQEPGSNIEIASFCKKNYGVTFLLTDKIDVKGDGQHPVYSWLTSKAKNGKQDSEVKWNFHKYLVDEQGTLVAEFPSSVKPFDERLITLLQ